MPGVNYAPDAEDESKTTTPNDPVLDNVIEPNDSGPEGNDLTVNKVKVNGEPINSNGLSTIARPSGA